MSVLIAIAAQHDPSWRHFATLLLLVVTLPVFVLGSLLAMPVLLVVGSAEGLRRVWLRRDAHHRRPC